MTCYQPISPPDPMGRGDPWFSLTFDEDFQPIHIDIGLNIANSHGWRQRAMKADRKKKWTQRRIILAALMQSPLYFTVPLSERHLLIQRILECFGN